MCALSLAVELEKKKKSDNNIEKEITQDLILLNESLSKILK